MLTLIATFMLATQKPEAITIRDREVLDAYMNSLSQSPDDYVVVLPEAGGRLYELCLKTLDEYLKDKPELVPLSKNLADRNTKRIRIDGPGWPKNVAFFDFNQQPELTRDHNFRKLFAQNVRAFGFDLPGYSEDGKSAVIFAWLGPNHIHSVHDVAILKLTDGKWKIAWHQLAFYV